MVFCRLNSQLIFNIKRALGHLPPPPREKWPAVWQAVLFLKGDVIYPQYQTLQSAGTECSTDQQTHLSDIQEGGKHVEQDKGSGGKSRGTSNKTATGLILITANVSDTFAFTEASILSVQ